VKPENLYLWREVAYPRDRQIIIYLFLIQQFITWDAVVDRGSCNVTTYVERKEKGKKGPEKEKEKARQIMSDQDRIPFNDR